MTSLDHHEGEQAGADHAGQQQADLGQGRLLGLNCPRCRLTITVRTDWLGVEHCPRCIARRCILVRLFPSQ